MPILRSERGDIWGYESTHFVVVPTNVGWRTDPSGANVMGKGLAKQAAERHPQLPGDYGGWCREMREIPCFWFLAPLILVPVKPLNEKAPHLSWMSKASLKLIEEGLRFLRDNVTPEKLSDMPFSFAPKVRPVAVPLLGCGAGGLAMDDVRPIMDRILGGDDRFVLILQNAV